ncbi:MAG: thioredoxin family protein [Bacteroidaceae bacterium]|nr:thioredoxin family protein [Bacteroidaceae bacterium]
MTTFLTILLAFLQALPFGPAPKPVTATNRIEQVAADTVRLSFDLKISDGWHVYSTGLPVGGPISAELNLDAFVGLEPVSKLLFKGDEIEVDDPVFGMRVRYFEKKVTFYQNFKITRAGWSIEGALTYGACDDESCLPPQRVEFSHADASAVLPAAQEEESISDIDGFDDLLWKPVTYSDAGAMTGGGSLWGLFLTSFIGGLIALLTPCVWPIIPMTVSFFLKRSQERRKAIRDAIVYGLSIIAVYVALALIITLIFGANALNALATNAFVNILFFLILVAFALSFFGVFEITLPSSWSTGTDRKSSSAAGLGGIFFMALTLTIVSFSCTGPIIGFLLVDAASTGSILAPTVGMLGFSVAMAIPFTLFAMFPGWLQTMPKSGGWMDRVKVSLGVIELAFSLKFLSVADMAYGKGLLPRDLFIILWILMALFLGIYLIRHRSGKAGLAAGIVSLAFAAWMVPGLWGAPLKAISAFTPPMSTQKFGHNDQTVEPQFTDYSEAIIASEISGKPILVDFTGYGCVNCRKMEAAVWTDPNVSETIKRNYILVSLFVDDKTPLPKSWKINENGNTVKIRTVGDKWSLLQRHKFGANAQPFYVIIDSKGKLIAGPYTFDPDPEKFLKFLTSSLS